MTMPAGLWLTLLTAVLWYAVPMRWRTCRLQCLFTLLVFAGMISPFVLSTELLFTPWTWGAAAIWWWGSQSATDADQSANRLRWGRTVAALAGLQILVTTHDWVTWVLALELTRWGTASLYDDTHDLAESCCRWLLVAGVLGWVGTLGTISFEEMRQILEQYYSTPVGGSAIGRPSLVLVGSTALLMFGLFAPIFLAASGHSTQEPRSSWLSGLQGRFLASGLAFVSWIDGGLVGMQVSMLVLLTVLMICVWCFALSDLTEPQRLDRNLAGISLVTGSLWLLSAVTFLGQPQWVETPGAIMTSFVPGDGVATGMFHWILAQVVLLISLQGLLANEQNHWYCDRLRGLGRVSPFRTALYLVSLASLLGLPGTWGFIELLRMQWAWLGIHTMGHQDLVLAHTGLRGLALGAVLSLATAVVTASQQARLLLFEFPVWLDLPPCRIWWLMFPLAGALFLLGFGLFPQTYL